VKPAWPRALIAAGLALVLGCRARTAPPERFQGVVEYEERQLGFPLGGVIAEVAVVEGQRVTAGSPLAAIDDQLERAQHDGRVAEAAAAQARLGLLLAGTRAELITQVQARLTGASASERSAEQRLNDERALSRVGAAPAAGVIDREAALAEALATRRALEEELRALRRGARPEEITAARATAAAARAAVAGSEARLRQHALTAPTEGTVLDVHARSGEVVSAGQPVVTIADTAHPYLDVFVPQARIAEVALGAKVKIWVDSLAQPLAGTVEHIARRTEFTPTYVFSIKERPHFVIRVRVRVTPTANEALAAGVPAFVAIDPTAASGRRPTGEAGEVPGEAGEVPAPGARRSPIVGKP
jgi:HlyD family secretion protein